VHHGAVFLAASSCTGHKSATTSSRSILQASGKVIRTIRNEKKEHSTTSFGQERRQDKLRVKRPTLWLRIPPPNLLTHYN